LNKNRIIKKFIVLAAWLLVIAGLTTLLVAANRKQKEYSCKQVLIGIRSTEEKFYVEKEDVLKLIEKTAGGSLLNRSVTAIDLSKLEKGLKTNPWIKNAQLYFDNNDVLHVFIEEREPIARVFTALGSSFYMDSSGHRMPLLDKMSIRVPVVTGFTNARQYSAADSSLLDQTKKVAGFIYTNAFWNAQVGQINITPERKFELIPVVGDHIIRLGDGEDVEEKLNRLYIFYSQVMSKVGFNKYAAVDVAFKGQVVAVKKEPTSPVDSIQLQKNIQELLKRANLQNIEEEMLPDRTSVRNDSTISTSAAQTNAVSTKTDPNPVVLSQSNQNTAKKKTVIPTKPIERPKQSVTKKTVKRPKALLPKKVN
jgi:cell division protein FtsQ